MSDFFLAANISFKYDSGDEYDGSDGINSLKTSPVHEMFSDE